MNKQHINQTIAFKANIKCGIFFFIFGKKDFLFPQLYATSCFGFLLSKVSNVTQNLQKYCNFHPQWMEPSNAIRILPPGRKKLKYLNVPIKAFEGSVYEGTEIATFLQVRGDICKS